MVCDCPAQLQHTQQLLSSFCLVVDKLSLTSRALEIKIPVNKAGINTLVFHAHNLGEFPPNTAQLEILYGNKKEELTVSSDLTVSSVIDIEYKQ